jgi:DNA-binding transcriptional ArsR family regulator
VVASPVQKRKRYPMDFFERGRPRRLLDSQKQALNNPIRRRIVELFTAEEARWLTAEALAVDLGRFALVSVSQVGYHLACLRDAELIPGGKAEGR